MQQEEQDELENIIKAFQIDTIGLGAIAEAGKLTSNIPRFTSDRNTGKSHIKPLATRAMQRRISSGEGIFNTGDNDPDLAEWYKQLNSNQPGKVLAMNAGFDEAIDELPALNTDCLYRSQRQIARTKP